jgi:hypothetical protein
MTTGRILAAVNVDGAGAHPAAWRSLGAAEAALDPGFRPRKAEVARTAG